MRIEQGRKKERWVIFAKSNEGAWMDTCIPVIGSKTSKGYCVQITVDEIPKVENRYSVVIEYMDI